MKLNIFVPKKKDLINTQMKHKENSYDKVLSNQMGTKSTENFKECKF